MKIDIDGIANQIQSKIKDILYKADRTKLYMDIGEVLRSYMIEEQFATLGKFLNKKQWEPLSAGYKKKKAEKGRKPIADLQDTGRLAASFNYRAFNNGVTISNDVAYSKHLHYGTKYMPARPIFPETLLLPDEVMEHIEDVVKIWIVNQI